MAARAFPFLLALLFLVVPVIDATHASGVAPDITFDAGTTVSVDGGRWGYGVESVQRVTLGSAVAGAYDATWSNISYAEGAGAIGVSGTQTGLHVASVCGAAPNGRDLASDLEHLGKFNVTFPNFAFNGVGVWELRDGNGATIAREFFQPPTGAGVTLSPATLTLGATTTMTMHVTDEYGNPVPDGRVILRRDPDADASGDISGGLRVNGTGAPGAGQNGDYAFTVTPTSAGSYAAWATIGRYECGSNVGYERAGSAAFTVVSVPSTPLTGTYSLHSHSVKFRGGDAPVTGRSYDLTVTRILGVTSTTGYTLHDPTGAQVGNPRDLYVDQEHVGAFNVTFPATTFTSAGTWTLQGQGFSAHFLVRAPHGHGGGHSV
jgi:hypothetical protein